MLTYRTATILGDIPKDWATQRLRDVLSFHTAGDWGGEAGQVKVKAIRSTNFTDSGSLNFDDVATRYVDSETAALLEPRKNDLLLERSGGGPEQPVGRIGFVREDLPGHAFSNFIHLLRPDPDKIESDFLGWILHRIQSTGIIVRLEQQTTGMRNLHFRDYLTLLFPKPSKAEQRAIADILDAVDAAIERTRTAIDKAQRLKRGLMQRFFEVALGRISSADRPGRRVQRGWRLLPTGGLLDAEPKNGYSPECSPQPPGYPTFSIGAVRDGKIDLKNPEHLKYSRISDALAAKFAVRKGDILIVRGNANPDLVGKCGVIDEFPPGCIYSNILKRVSFRDTDDGVMPTYAALVWNHFLVHNQVLKLAKTSNGTLKINSRDVKRIVMPVPPRNEQTRLVDMVQAADHQIQTINAKLRSLERLKRGLMQDLLTGRKRVPATDTADAKTMATLQPV